MFFFPLPVPEDLSLEERDELSNIRRRKKELLDDIEVSDCRDPVFVTCTWICVLLLFFYELSLLRPSPSQRLKFEIAEVMTEIEQLTCVGER